MCKNRINDVLRNNKTEKRKTNDVRRDATCTVRLITEKANHDILYRLV